MCLSGIFCFHLRSQTLLPLRFHFGGMIIWNIFLGYCFQFSSNLYDSVIVLGYLDWPWVFELLVSSTKFPNLESSTPNRKAHVSNTSLEFYWTWMIYCSLASVISMGDLSVPMFPPPAWNQISLHLVPRSQCRSWINCCSQVKLCPYLAYKCKGAYCNRGSLEVGTLWTRSKTLLSWYCLVWIWGSHSRLLYDGSSIPRYWLVIPHYIEPL